ncbi:MAG TPA: hypothetical protein VNS22_03575 [Geminicoccus sp.]|uniref:hypothetical protein n=1 Tax=Geminicoccus sp. TaxID=2024832 RepID=UPI002CF6A007|nr:hypothetical protein [Geminicoccus sp.]HWL67445.1 hypothetical protein [Geminicoccus sp.]
MALRLGLAQALAFSGQISAEVLPPVSPPPPPPPPPPPVVETNFLLAASGDPLVDEAGNNLVWENS